MGFVGTPGWDVWAQGTPVGQICRDPEMTELPKTKVKESMETLRAVRGRYRFLSWGHRESWTPSKGQRGDMDI